MYKQGAFLDINQARLARAFGIDPWSYHKISPKELLKQLEKQTKEFRGGDASAEQRVGT